MPQRPSSASVGIASLVVRGKDGAISVIGHDGDRPSPRGAMEGDLSGEFMEQYGPDQGEAERQIYRPREKFAHELGKGSGDAGDLKSLQDELRQIQDERRALLQKTNSLAGIPEDQRRAPDPHRRRHPSQGTGRPPYQQQQQHQQQHAAAGSGPGGGRARSAGAAGHRTGQPAASPYAPNQLGARRLSDPAESPAASKNRRAAAGEDGRGAAPDPSPAAVAEEELRRRLLTEVTDAIEAAFAAEVAAAAVDGAKGKQGRQPSANSKRPSRRDVESVAQFAVKAAKLQVESAQEDIERRAREKRAKAVASAEARAEERLSDAVKSGREARESAAAATAGLQQARAELDKLRAERRNLTERVERWRKERDAAADREAEMAIKLEEAQKKERAASKEASKAVKRADKADGEAARLEGELSAATEELQASRAQLAKAREEHRAELETAAAERLAAVDAARRELLDSQQERVDLAVGEVTAAAKDSNNFCKVELCALEAAMREQLQEAAAALEEAMRQQAEGGEALRREVQAARASLVEAAAEVEAEAAKGREAVTRQLEAVVRPGGKDPQELARDNESLRAELQALAADNSDLARRADALEAERVAAAESLAAEAELAAALGKQIAAKDLEIEALRTDGKALLQSVAAKDEGLQAAAIRDKQRLQTIGALEQQRDAVADELESTRQRLHEQLSIVADKALQAAKLEGQMEGMQAKLAKELRSAHGAADDASKETLKALQALRQRYFEVKPEQPRRLQKVPSSKGAGPPAGFGSSNTQRGDGATLQRRNSSNSRKGAPDLEGGGLALPGGCDGEAEGWLAIKLTDRGVDPALREWSKKVSGAWGAQKGSQEDEEDFQTEPQRVSRRAASIQREILRIEGAMLLALQEAIRVPPAPTGSPAKASPTSQANNTPKTTAGSRGTAPTKAQAPNAVRSGSVPAASISSKADYSEEAPSELEKRLRGARERVERIRGDVEDGALKTFAAMDGTSNPPAAMEGLIRRRSATGSSTEVSPRMPGGSFGRPAPSAALEGDAEEEVMAVLDMLGRTSINAAPPRGAFPPQMEQEEAAVAAALSADENKQPVVRPSPGQPATVPSGGRPASASSHARLQLELGYGGAGLGAASTNPGRPEWQ